jgi:lysophospholipase L1-like esterase
MNICIFGDSITEGLYDNEKNGWVNRLKEKFGNDEIFNFGISGDTTDDLLARFNRDTSGKQLNAVMFAVGINDSIYLPKQKRNYVSFEKFEENLKTLAKKAKQHTKKIIFLGLTPVDESLTMPISWELEMHYSNDQVRKYNDVIKQFCRDEKIQFIDILDDFLKDDYRHMLSNGLHPNAEGYEWIANKVAKNF